MSPDMSAINSFATAIASADGTTAGAVVLAPCDAAERTAPNVTADASSATRRIFMTIPSRSLSLKRLASLDRTALYHAIIRFRYCAGPTTSWLLAQSRNHRISALHPD